MQVKALTVYSHSVISKPANYCQESMTWEDITTTGTHFRVRPLGWLDNVRGLSVIAPDTHGLFVIAMCKSTALFSFLKIMSPTLSTQAGEVAQLPAVLEGSRRAYIEDFAGSTTSVPKTNWDSLMTPWDYAELPRIRLRKPCETLEQTYVVWKTDCIDRFYHHKANEEEHNRIFAAVYHMGAEFPIEVPLDKVRVYTA